MTIVPIATATLILDNSLEEKNPQSLGSIASEVALIAKNRLKRRELSDIAPPPFFSLAGFQTQAKYVGRLGGGEIHLVFPFPENGKNYSWKCCWLTSVSRHRVDEEEIVRVECGDFDRLGRLSVRLLLTNGH